MYKVVKGNAIDIAIQNKAHFGHGCNCICAIHNGMAKEVRERLYPLVEADLETTPGDYDKLGNYTMYEFEWGFGFNLYTQRTNSREGVECDYAAIRDSVQAAFDYIRGTDNRPLVIPKIGSGLANGDWDLIENILKQATPYDCTLIVVEFDKTVSKQPTL